MCKLEEQADHGDYMLSELPAIRQQSHPQVKSCV